MTATLIFLPGEWELRADCSLHHHLNPMATEGTPNLTWASKKDSLGNQGLPEASSRGRADGTCLVVQWLRLHTPNARGRGLIPGRGTKMPHAAANKTEEELMERGGKEHLLEIKALDSNSNPLNC